MTQTLEVGLHVRAGILGLGWWRATVYQEQTAKRQHDAISGNRY
jgi:hypothetical protein